MARFCTECGKEIASGVAFCTECGAKVNADPTPQTAEPVTAVKTEPKVEAKPENTVHTTPPQTYQVRQAYNPPVQTVYAPPVPNTTNKVVSTGAYFGLMLLFALPIIGFIACIIMAFAPRNKNIKHFARAMLIWMIIAFVITGLLMALFSLLTNVVVDYFNQIGDGQFGEFEDFFNQLSELGKMTEQFENGGLGSLPLE